MLIGFELVLTHWFYLYLPWFFPFVVLALVAPRPGRPRVSSRMRGGVTRLVAAGLFLACFGLVHTWFWAHGDIVDWPTYQSYGSAIVDHHLVPYRDFAVEYPPGALPVFVCRRSSTTTRARSNGLSPRAASPLVGVLAFVRREAALYAALTPLLVGSLILRGTISGRRCSSSPRWQRCSSGRDGVGWAFLGAAVAAKLWPLVIVPPALLWSARRGQRARALAGVAVAASHSSPFARDRAPRPLAQRDQPGITAAAGRESSARRS